MNAVGNASQLSLPAAFQQPRTKATAASRHGGTTAATAAAGVTVSLGQSQNSPGNGTYSVSSVRKASGSSPIAPPPPKAPSRGGSSGNGKTGSGLSKTTATPSSTSTAATSGDASSTTEPASTTLVANGGDVTVSILNSDSGYDNRIYWSTDNFATQHSLGIDNHTGTFDLGSFAAGTKIDFGIDNGVGGFYRTGPATSNADGFQHTQATQTSGGTQIGFEDLQGGGDQDFNDAIVNVLGARPGGRPAKPPAPRAPPANGDGGNHSGLGDGTNPGQGVGTGHSPNQGTDNPSQGASGSSNPPASTPLPASNGNGNHHSGLGDGTNPGHGAGRSNSPNPGTLNPSKSGKLMPSAGVRASKRYSLVARFT